MTDWLSSGLSISYVPETTKNTLYSEKFFLTCISAAAASPSPDAPALSSPSLSPCGRRERMNRPHSHWRFQRRRGGGRSSVGLLRLGHESLSPWETKCSVSKYTCAAPSGSSVHYRARLFFWQSFSPFPYNVVHVRSLKNFVFITNSKKLQLIPVHWLVRGKISREKPNLSLF